MQASRAILRAAYRHDVLVLEPRRELAESDYQDFSREVDQVLLQIDQGLARHLVIDFNRTEYFGCTAVAYFFLKLWRTVRLRGGQMAFCCLSDYEREVLAVSRLDKLWPLCESLEEAVLLLSGKRDPADG